MLILSAVDQANAVESWLSSNRPILDLDYWKSYIDSYVSLSFSISSNFSIDSQDQSFKDSLLELEEGVSSQWAHAKWLIDSRWSAPPDPFYILYPLSLKLDRFIKRSNDFFLDLSITSEELLNFATTLRSEVAHPDFAPNDNFLLKLRQVDGRANYMLWMHEIWRGDYLALTSVIEAWQSFRNPNSQPYNYAGILISFPEGSLTIPQCIEWLTFFQGVSEFSFAAAGMFEESAEVRLERLEVGSLWQSVLGVPEVVLTEIKDFFQRGFNKRTTEANAVLKEIEGIDKMLDVYDRLEIMVRNGSLTAAQAEGIRVKLAVKNSLPFWDSVTVIEVNGEVVATLQAADPSSMLLSGEE